MPTQVASALQNPGIARSVEFRLRTKDGRVPGTPLPVFHVRRTVYALVEVVAVPGEARERYFSLVGGQGRTEYTLGKPVRMGAISAPRHPGVNSTGCVCHQTVAAACCAEQRHQARLHTSTALPTTTIVRQAHT